jgi:hypothetical protein
MKSPLLTALLVILLALPVAGQEPDIDYSGLHELAGIVALLERDVEPGDGAWRRLFDTSGYAALTRSEFAEAFFSDHLRLVFLPSLRTELDEALATVTGWRGAYLRHFVQVRERLEEVLGWAADPRPGRMIPRAQHLALQFLPRSAGYEFPPVAFVVFGPDARGYVPVVLDVLTAIDRHDDLLLLLAHEFHHYHRNALLRYDNVAVVPDDEDIMWILNQLQAEGMANQVNLGPAFLDREAFGRGRPEFLAQYLESPAMIRRIDTVLTTLEGRLEGRAELGLALRQELPSAGHPTGFFMANLVARELGMDALVAEVGNPFAFLRLYHAAALARAARGGAGDVDGGAPPLSSASLRFIGTLEDRYLKPARARPDARADTRPPACALLE